MPLARARSRAQAPASAVKRKNCEVLITTAMLIRMHDLERLREATRAPPASASPPTGGRVGRWMRRKARAVNAFLDDLLDL
jgi:hypothetical protein